MSDRTLVLVDEAHQYAITWNGSLTFNVWTALTNGFSTRLLREVNCFTSDEPVADEDDAAIHAWQWWAEDGCASTRQMEAELLGITVR